MIADHGMHMVTWTVPVGRFEEPEYNRRPLMEI